MEWKKADLSPCPIPSPSPANPSGYEASSRPKAQYLPILHFHFAFQPTKHPPDKGQPAPLHSLPAGCGTPGSSFPSPPLPHWLRCRRRRCRTATNAIQCTRVRAAVPTRSRSGRDSKPTARIPSIIPKSTLPSSKPGLPRAVERSSSEYPLPPSSSLRLHNSSFLLEVGGEVRVIRQCAYLGEDTELTVRVGSAGVRMWYYQCSEKDLCNHARRTQLSLTAALLLISVHVALFL